MNKYPSTRVVLLALLLVSSVLLQASIVLAAECNPDPTKEKEPLLCTRSTGIKLLQPLDDSTETLKPSAEPLGVFFEYFNMSWPWVIGVASGIAILQAIIGGVQIMISGGDAEEGKTRLKWALGGLVMIALAGFILRFLNPMFYR